MVDLLRSEGSCLSRHLNSKGHFRMRPPRQSGREARCENAVGLKSSRRRHDSAFFSLGLMAGSTTQATLGQVLPHSTTQEVEPSNARELLQVITKGLLRIRRLREVSNIKENKLPEFKMAYPETNKALLFTTIGQDLEVVEKEVPPLPANEILVKVHAASINPVDIQLWRSGLVGVVASTKGMGRDFSGTVVAVGSSVRGWVECDDIFGLLFHVVCLQS
jgi:hypothetical protein